jgi:hypothetical protein
MQPQASPVAHHLREFDRVRADIHAYPSLLISGEQR